MLASTGTAAVTAHGATLDLTAFGARPGDHSDTTPAVRAALEQCRATGARKLLFPPGRYDFWPDRAVEEYLFISNNDEGLKRIAFPLLGLENLEIDGQGAHCIFHGFVNPFVLQQARNITLRNFSIDWERTFHSEGRVLRAGEESVDLAIDEQFPYKIDNGLLVFTGEGQEASEIYPVGSLLEFDAKKRETAFMALDYWTGRHIQATEIGPRQVRVMLPKLRATPGNIFVFGAGHRLIPAFTISDSAATTLANVNIYHCGGMGVIAQRSRDIELDHVQVTPAPDSGRMVSVTADATHFVNCTGRIVMSHCLFENQKDDATNIHGIYAQVTRQLAPDAIEVQLKHAQQLGFDFIEPGERLELVHGPSMVTYHEAVVQAAQRLNKEYTRVVFESPLPPELAVGDAVASVDGYPEVTISHCTIRNNRARGLLLGSRGKTVIEDNLFHTPGAAILLEGDARFWFEQAGVRDLVIRRNRFVNCNFGVWGQAAIEVGVGIAKEHRAASRYNRHIVIEDNTFHVFDGRLVLAYSVDGLTIRRNRIEPSTDYPPQHQDANPFDISDCDQVTVRKNSWSGSP